MGLPLAAADFETKGIEGRPDYPPIPVGVAIRRGGSSKYLAWGHPCENNCTKAQARKELSELYRTHEVVFHNSAFDLEVGTQHLGLLPPKKFHDTLFLAFLHDPRDKSLSLKPLSAKYLGMPPDEQDRLREWILENVKEAKPSDWGAYISEAPGKLVGVYAKGDVDRTLKLFKLFYTHIIATGMREAYERELKLMPIVVKMEQGGVRVNVKALKKDVKVWEHKVGEYTKWVHKRLGGTFNIDSNEQLADMLEKKGKISHWVYTAPSKKYPDGQRSISRKNLEVGCNDRKLLDVLAVRGILSTYIGTFARPWIERGEKNDWYLHPKFNQVRSTDEYGGRGGVGTRTGRFSSSEPNFQNVPSDPADKEGSNDWAKELPFLRNYVLPDEGCAFIGRDYSQQELRILAHYEDGEFLAQYMADPRMDVHEFARQMIHRRTGVLYPRKFIKVTGFGIIYGMGVGKLAAQLGIDDKDARDLKASYLGAIPGIKKLNTGLKDEAYNGEPIRTWGGRLYYCEEPKMVKGKRRTFEYKMLNLLIQGSAADCTKEAMINVSEVWDKHARLVVQVHDELLGCCPLGKEKKYMKKMQEAMEDVKFDLPMLSDGKMSKISWGKMKDYEVRA